jgi:tRNA modification GTPase
VRLDLAEVPVTLLDTAGLRDALDPVEAEGVRRARARAEQADLVILVTDASAQTTYVEPATAVAETLRVYNKIDLAYTVPKGVLAVSALSGTGIDQLREALAAAVRALTASKGPPPLTRARHRAALRQASDFLTQALAVPSAELRSEDLRMALRSLGTITGRVGVDDVLASVFAQFCIGK